MPLDIKQVHNFEAGAKIKGYGMGPGVPQSRWKQSSGVRSLTMPGLVTSSVGGAVTFNGLSGNFLIYEPVILDYPGVLEALVIYIVTANAAGSGVKCALTKADKDWHPVGSRLWTNNSSPIAIDTTGQKSVTGIALPVDPGRYFIVYVHNTSGFAGITSIKGDLGGDYVNPWGGSPLLHILYRNVGNPWYAGGIPDPVPQPDTWVPTTNGTPHFFFWDLSSYPS